MPFFAGGAHGWSLLSLSSASGGYLWGLVAVAFLVGFLARNGWDRTLRSSIGAMFLSEAVQCTVAIPWLAGLSVQKALVLGLYPSVLGMHSSSRGRRLAPSRLAVRRRREG